MSKSPGWEGRLTAYLHTIHNKPFRPASLDCGMFFAGAVVQITGVDHGLNFRGRYKTIEAGKAVLAEMGFADHVAYADSLFEAHPSPLMAQRGDGAVIKDHSGGDALGIVQGEYVYVMGLTGLGLVPLTHATKAYKI